MGEQPLPQFLAGLGKSEIKPGGSYATGALLRKLDLRGRDRVMVAGPASAETALFVSMTTRAATEALVGHEKDKLSDVDDSLERRSTSRVGRPDELPFPDDYFDAAMVEATLSYQPVSLQKASLAELARVIKPGGLLGLHELVWRQPPTEEVEACLRTVWGGEIQPHVVRGWWDLLEESGFGEISNDLAVVSYFTRQGMHNDEGESAVDIFHSAFEDPAALKRFTGAYREFSDNRRYYGVIIATARRGGTQSARPND